MMARSEPSILFAQSFIHPQLDEYVDEILFAEPVVITACEFLEQNASPFPPSLSLVGATSPPSFALEVFVHCKGESRFRRLCEPFLYSHSSSNILEVEAVVTSHLVLRGMYRSLTLIVYGNTAEDLGQFNIDIDLDSSLANVVRSPSEGTLEDLPPALNSAKLSLEESLCSLSRLSLRLADIDLSPEIKRFLLLILKICNCPDADGMISKVASVAVPIVSSYVKGDDGLPLCLGEKESISFARKKSDRHKAFSLLVDDVVRIFKDDNLVDVSGVLDDGVPEAELISLNDLLEMFYQRFPFLGNGSVAEIPLIFQNEKMILALSLVLLFCSSRESCSHFISTGGLEQIVRFLAVERSTAITLLLLSVAEVATRHGVGCEGFLGWWPRVDEAVPTKKSDGYCNLLKLLLAKQRHDVASLATHILLRLRLYEIVSRYEATSLALLSTAEEDHSNETFVFDSLILANSLITKTLNLLTLGPIEDPSQVAFAQPLSIPAHSDGVLSFRATITCINKSKFTFSKCDMDLHQLSLLEERGFFPLSAAILSSPNLRSESEKTMDAFLEFLKSFHYILLMLLFHRSGLIFLTDSESTALIGHSLQDAEDGEKIECMTLRQASVFLSKGFFCRPQEVGMIMELHLRVVTAIHMLLTTPLSDDLLWVLWEVCSISRSHAGKEAVLALTHFPEAVAVLAEILLSFKGSEPNDSGLLSSNPAIFHSAAEILEVLVTDSTAFSLLSWIEHALDLHKALHASSPGSNRKDAPTRLLEWIDAGAIYQKNGAVGLLRYAAILASGGDAHLSSSTVLVTDSIEVENVVGDSTSYSDAQVIENLLGKLVSDKYFDGATLHSSSIVKLTMTFRILAFISENSAAAASLYEEGAVTLIYVVLLNCRFMLEHLSNTYDYLVDEGTECNSTADLLLERSHEHNIIDLLVPCLILLISLLREIQEAKEQYRNKKLLTALLLLHREVSPKLAACSADFSIPYPNSALGFATICHLLASALACWPIFGWTPGLFHCLLENVQVTSALALGPKDACSILYLLGDFFPEEDIWLWQNELPPLSALQILSVGTLLGPQAEEWIDWYLEPKNLMVLLVRLTPQLDRIALIVLHFASTALVVLQDMLRVFVVRVACQSCDCAVALMRPIISCIDNNVGQHFLCEEDVFKTQKLLIFITSLLDHPVGKPLLVKVGALKMLDRVLNRCITSSSPDDKLAQEGRVVSNAVSPLCWCIPALKSLSLIFDLQSALSVPCVQNKYSDVNLSAEDISLVACDLLKLLEVLPVGRELLLCMVTFKHLASCDLGQSAIGTITLQYLTSFSNYRSHDKDPCESGPDENDWRFHFPFLTFWKKLLCSIESENFVPDFFVETVLAIVSVAMCLSKEGENSEGVDICKSLFGILPCPGDSGNSSSGKTKYVCELVETLERVILEDECFKSLPESAVSLVKGSVKVILLLLNSPVGSTVKKEDIDLPSNGYTASLSDFCKSNGQVGSDLLLDEFMDKFVWECPDYLSDRQLTLTLPMKRKLPASEGLNKRGRDLLAPETVNGVSAPSRGVNAPGQISALSRRDTFRQRKPNTSRPPSMHVDDYVAREKNIDGPTGGGLNNSSSSHRGPASGRPPSIHVDEFMARQRERQSQTSLTTSVGDLHQARESSIEKSEHLNKYDKSSKLKADPDDELQGIDIIFDEEIGHDDKLPFPHPDDNLQPTPAVVGGNSPHSVVEETEGDTNETARFPLSSTPSSTKDKDGGFFMDNTPLRRASSLPEVPVTQESWISPRKSFPSLNMERSVFYEKSDESKYSSSAVNMKGFDASPANIASSFPLSMQSQTPLLFYQRGSPQTVPDNIPLVGTFQGYQEPKLPIEQPPLPPMPPPNRPIVSAPALDLAQLSRSSYVSSRDGPPPLPSGFPPQVENNISIGNRGASLSLAQPILDTRFSWNMLPTAETLSSNASLRPLPPLPPLPPPSTSAVALSSVLNSNTQTTNQSASGTAHPQPAAMLRDSQVGFFSSASSSLASFPGSPYVQSLLIARPSVPGTLFSPQTLQQSQNLLGISQPPSSQAPIQPMQPRLPPPPPPHLPRPQLPEPSISLIQAISQQTEQFTQLQQSSYPVQVKPLQVRQQLQVPNLQFYGQGQQESLARPVQQLLEQPQSANVRTDAPPQQQREGGMSLEQYISSPEAIQALLNDREKLRQLLEQHPRIMQMLQERLGQGSNN